MPWTLKQAGSHKGRRMLITGSNTGIGFATAKLFAQSGASIVLACRNAKKGTEALSRLRMLVPGVDASLLQLDLASLDSVRKAGETMLASRHGIDVLVNNAGLMMPPFSRTADGFELQFGTNVLGHFAFTGLLLPLLQTRSRVVWLSSVAHWNGRIDFDNLNAEKGYGKWQAYAQSKLADLMLACEMQRRLARRGATIASLAAHPGGTRSELSRNNRLLQWLSKIGSPFLQTTEAGAMPSVRAALDPDAKGGEFYGPGGLTTMAGPPVKQASSRRSRDETVATRLWQACEELTGVRWLD
jgi:NAD(P)-dependent dehydrogenase (short-subunit alcohol dehydrogenase family)